MKERKKDRKKSENILTTEEMHVVFKSEREKKMPKKNELSVGDSNPGLSRDRRRYLTNYTNRDF